MTKRALVVGINDYRNWHDTRGFKFSDLDCCRNDATAFAGMLSDAFGFHADNITLLEDGEATRQAILDGIATLLARCDYGDVMCFYFSGHGARVSERGMLRPSPRYYETIVPYDDAAMISDWELNAIAQSLEPSKVNFTVVLDSCHAGGILEPTDGDRPHSGHWSPAQIAQFVQGVTTLCPLMLIPDLRVLDGNVSTPMASDHGVRVNVQHDKDFHDTARATLLAACDFHESAWENDDVGYSRFTHAMLDTVNQSNFLMDHPSFISEIRQHVKAATDGKQTPQLRGRPVRLEENLLAEWNYSI